MDKNIYKTLPITPPEKVKVLVNLDKQVIEMAEIMEPVHDADSFSAYVRKLIRADFRRHERRLARQEKAVPA